MAAPTFHGSSSRRWCVLAGVAVLLTGLKFWWAAPEVTAGRVFVVAMRCSPRRGETP